MKNFWVFCFAAAVTIIILWQVSFKLCEMDIIVDDFMSKGNDLVQSYYLKANEDNNTERAFLKRLSDLKYQCQNHALNNSEKLPRLYTTKNNNLKYCKVPKCGSTFWMSVFIILNQMDDDRNPFGNIRSGIHHKSDKFRKEMNSSTFSVSDVVVFVARDPFSRIYSAFIDKIFLPGFWHAYPHIKKDNTPTCEKSNTFSVFVDFIIRSKLNRKPLNKHWKPISEICNPCRIPYNFIIKQETFHRDVLFVLNQTDITNSKRQKILAGLQTNHVNYSMEEILKVQSSFAKKANRSCMPFDDFTRRLWQAFQIQGYISDSIPFPEKKFVGLNYSSVKEMKELYLQGAYQYKLSNDEKTKQRNHYLLQAYRTISKESIQTLLKIYDDDFRLLGYSSLPPHLQSARLYKDI